MNGCPSEIPWCHEHRRLNDDLHAHDLDEQTAGDGGIVRHPGSDFFPASVEKVDIRVSGSVLCSAESGRWWDARVLLLHGRDGSIEMHAEDAHELGMLLIAAAFKVGGHAYADAPLDVNDYPAAVAA